MSIFIQSEQGKVFFFAKKKQKTFAPGACIKACAGFASAHFAEPAHAAVQAPEAKVFCFFFAKKKALLTYAA